MIPNNPANPDASEVRSDDEAYMDSPHLFTADRLGKLVRIAERDPKRQVLVPLDTINKIYLSHISILDVYQEQSAAGVNINGRVYLCSEALSRAIQPLVDAQYLKQAEADVDRAMSAAQVDGSGESR